MALELTLESSVKQERGEEEPENPRQREQPRNCWQVKGEGLHGGIARPTFPGWTLPFFYMRLDLALPKQNLLRRLTTPFLLSLGL